MLVYSSFIVGASQEGEKSEETKRLRAKVSEGCEDAIQKFFEKQNGQVVIYDANNGTRAARAAIAEKFHKIGIHIIFLGEPVYLSIDKASINEPLQKTCAITRKL